MKKTSGRYVIFHAVHELIFVVIVGVVAACYAGTPPATAAVNEQRTFDLNTVLYRIFATKDLDIKSFGPARWLNGGEAYTTLEPSTAVVGAKDIVRYETSTGKRDILVSAS